VNCIRSRWIFTDKHDGHHVPATRHGDAGADHAVSERPPSVELAQSHQRLIDVHFNDFRCFPIAIECRKIDGSSTKSSQNGLDYNSKETITCRPTAGPPSRRFEIILCFVQTPRRANCHVRFNNLFVSPFRFVGNRLRELRLYRHIVNTVW